MSAQNELRKAAEDCARALAMDSSHIPAIVSTILPVMESALRSVTPAPLTDVSRESLGKIGERLRTQDNRATAHPMFCVQVKIRDVGYDSNYCDDKCWHNSEQCETVYQEPEDLTGWDEFGYRDRWETVMVAFTEDGCKEYLDLNGHNDRRRAHDGEVRIYVESYNRCPEMITIREALKASQLSREIVAKKETCDMEFDGYTGRHNFKCGSWIKLQGHEGIIKSCPFCGNPITQNSEEKL